MTLTKPLLACALLGAFASLPALADSVPAERAPEASRSVLSFSMYTPDSAAYLVASLDGNGFKRVGGGDAPAALDGWTPHWYWAGTWVRSARAWAVKPGDKLSLSDGLLVVQSDAVSSLYKVDSLALCPSVPDPSPQDCVVPSGYEVSSIYALLGVRESKRSFGTLKALNASGFRGFKVIPDDVRAAESLRVAKELDERHGRATQERQRRAEADRLERERRNAAEDDARRRQAAWTASASQGAVLMCDTKQTIVPVGLSLQDTPLYCAFPEIGARSIDIKALLAAGWRIESHLVQPAEGVSGRVGNLVSVVLRKV